MINLQLKVITWCSNLILSIGCLPIQLVNQLSEVLLRLVPSKFHRRCQDRPHLELFGHYLEVALHLLERVEFVLGRKAHQVFLDQLVHLVPMPTHDLLQCI